VLDRRRCGNAASPSMSFADAPASLESEA
jgi:hypothetical protein